VFDQDQIIYIQVPYKIKTKYTYTHLSLFDDVDLGH